MQKILILFIFDVFNGSQRMFNKKHLNLNFVIKNDSFLE